MHKLNKMLGKTKDQAAEARAEIDREKAEKDRIEHDRRENLREQRKLEM